MGGFCAIVMVVGIFGLILLGVLSGGAGYAALVKSGLPAKGILLQVAPTSTVTGTLGNRIETRRVKLDVELPGEAPYEVSTLVYIPVNLRNDVLPGATVELRVNPKKRSDIAIVGPGVGIPAALFSQPLAKASKAPSPAGAKVS